MVELPTTMTGRLFSSGVVGGIAFMATSYSNSQILAVPDGRTMFCWPRAVTTAAGESALDWSRRWSRSTMTWRCLPPYGYGMEAPGTVTSWVRKKLRPTSLSSDSDMPDRASWGIGTVDAL